MKKARSHFQLHVGRKLSVQLIPSGSHECFFCVRDKKIVNPGPARTDSALRVSTDSGHF